MAIVLITPEEAKAFLVVEHTDDEKLIDMLLLQAHARLQGYVGRGLDSFSRTETHDGGSAALFLRHWPVASVTSVTDNQGTVGTGDDEALETSEYRLDGTTGMLWRTTQHAGKRLWEPGQERFDVIYVGGMEASDDWADYERDELASSVRDLVSHWYDHRDPGLLEEREGMGIGRRWESFMQSAGLPASVKGVWDTYVVRA